MPEAKQHPDLDWAMRVPAIPIRSFRSRILALVLGLVTIALAATVAAVVVKAREAVGREASQQLATAADTARQILRFRGNQLTSAVEVLTGDFGFKEAVASGDTPTLMSAMANHQSRIGADVLIILRPTAGWSRARSRDFQRAHSRISNHSSQVMRTGSCFGSTVSSTACRISWCSHRFGRQSRSPGPRWALP